MHEIKRWRARITACALTFSISFFGFGAPTGTPAAIIDKLNREVNAALADQKIKAQLEDLGLRVLSGSPTDYGKLIAEDTSSIGCCRASGTPLSW